MTKLNKPEKLFEILRESQILGPSLDQDEVDGVNSIIEACTKANWPLSWTAYALATAYLETAHKMQPIKEYGGRSYFTRMYDVQGHRPETARRNGNTSPGDGAKYCGRGYVQLTWKNNYAKAERELGADLVNNPELALKPSIAAEIMVKGMSEGWFTGVKCSTYLPNQGTASVEQFKRSRKIINGTDRDALIATYAIHFQDALVAGDYR